MAQIVGAAALMGLLPFLVGLLLSIWPSLSPLDPDILERAIIGYGALILSFLGGVRWGVRLQGGAGGDLIFIMGIFSAAGGFVTLLLPFTFAMVLLATGFALQGLWDARSPHLPVFYAKLRGMMTWLVCAIIMTIIAVRVIV